MPPQPTNQPIKPILARQAMFAGMSPEQQAKGRDTKRRNAAILRRDFADSNAWDTLAQERGIRLPQWAVPLTTGAIERWLRKLGITKATYLAWDGGKKLGDFRARNPGWPLRSWVGLQLETAKAATE